MKFSPGEAPAIGRRVRILAVGGAQGPAVRLMVTSCLGEALVMAARRLYSAEPVGSSMQRPPLTR